MLSSPESVKISILFGIHPLHLSSLFQWSLHFLEIAISTGFTWTNHSLLPLLSTCCSRALRVSHSMVISCASILSLLTESSLDCLPHELTMSPAIFTTEYSISEEWYTPLLPCLPGPFQGSSALQKKSPALFQAQATCLSHPLPLLIPLPNSLKTLALGSLSSFLSLLPFIILAHFKAHSTLGPDLSFLWLHHFQWTSTSLVCSYRYDHILDLFFFFKSLVI